MLGPQIVMLQEDKRVSQQALAHCQEQLNRLRNDYKTCTVSTALGTRTVPDVRRTQSLQNGLLCKHALLKSRRRSLTCQNAHA